jgi:hypothetical protein
MAAVWQWRGNRHCAADYDKGGNVVEGNRMSDAAAALIFNSLVPPGRMCGNVVETRRAAATVSDRYGADASPPDMTVPCR